jgi:O-antigen/teichoic acid export membrane protein
MIVSVVLGMVMTSADRIFVGRQFGQEALAHYSVAADICSRAYFLVWAVTGSIYTIYVKRRAVRRSADDLIRASLFSACLIAVCFYLPLALFARQIIGLWIGSAFAQSTVGVTRIWAAAAVAYVLMCVYYNHLQGFGKPRLLALSGVLGCTVLFAGLFTLTIPFGIEGAALSMLAGFAAQSIFLWWLSRRLSSRALP